MLNAAIDYTSQHIQLNPRLTSHPHRHHHISRLSTPTTHIRKLHSSHSLSSVPTLSSFNHTDSDSSLFDSPNALQSSVFSPSISSSSSSFSSSSFSTYSSSVQQPTSIQTTESGEEVDPKLRYLELVDPSPAFPPTYDSVNPSRHITFPIYEQSQTPCSNEDLPAYTPSIESIALVSMKQECEFIEAPRRRRKSHTSDNPQSVKRDVTGHWENYIMELNSTQLNFYSIDKSLMQDLANDTGSTIASDPPSPTLSPPTASSHSSSSSLLKFFQTALRRDRKKSVSNEDQCFQTCYSFRPADNERILPVVASDKNRYLSDVNLVKSYSLQYAKFGLPIGYLIRRKYKITEVNILRLCCESEQFLVKFTDVDTLIEWATSLSVGISISLDLDCRVAPEYRLYPRRIRRRSTSDDGNGSENGGMVTARSRSRSGSLHPVRPVYAARSHTSPNVPTWRPRSRSYSHHTAMSGFTPPTPRDEPESFLDGSSDTDDEDEESYEENQQYTERETSGVVATQEIGLGISGSFENNAMSTHENRTVYGNDNDDVDINSLLDDFNTFEQHNNSGATPHEVKLSWNPPPPKIPRKSYLSQTLRCLPLFHGTAKWMGEFFTRGALVAPKFQTNNEPIYYIDRAGDGGLNGKGNGNGSAGSRRNSRSDNSKGVNGGQFPVKNHYLDTFVMSSVGLVKIGSPLML